MTEDEQVELVRKLWGLKQQPPPDLLCAVKVKSLTQIIATSFEAIGTAGGFGLLIGDSGRPFLTEIDRLKRTLNWQIQDLFP